MTLKLALDKGIMTTLTKYSTLLRVLLRYWWFNLRVPKDINLYIKRWNSIDHRRDKSLAGKDFRFWYFNRKMAEWRGQDKA
jgi:hypothetical protein